jgi:deoxyhypusine synthase
MENSITSFIDKHFKHFNAASLRDASIDYRKHLEEGGKMMITLAGAMSTAELGISLAEMIRQNKVHIISCTGANLEEDLMNLVAHSHYKRVPNYRDLTPQDEWDLLEKGLNRVTDTCIPEEEAFRKIQKVIEKYWETANRKNTPMFPHEFIYWIIRNGDLESEYEIDPKDSWLLPVKEIYQSLYQVGKTLHLETYLHQT